MSVDRLVSFRPFARSRRTVLGALGLLAVGAVPAVGAPSGLAGPAVSVPDAPASASLRVTNLLPAFLRFHDAVTRAESLAVADRDVDAVDPGTALLEHWEKYAREVASSKGGPFPGDGAHELDPDHLETAWERYPSVMTRIRELGEGVTSAPETVLRQVSELLRLDRSLEVHLVLYVGIFEEPPAFRLRDGEFTILIPAELFSEPRTPALIDLFTRAVHARMAGRPPPGLNLSVAEHLAVRGLAMRVHEALVPGRPAEEYLLRAQAWLLDAERRDAAILERFRPILLARETEDLAAVGLGEEGRGAGGEFDYVAWRLGGLFLTHGWDLDRLAREPLVDLDRHVVGLLDP